MELFSNLLWLVLSSLLLSLWLWHRNRWRDDSLRSGVTVQLVALALLIVVLLPVVSLTDDLQANAMPAESEHFARRGDLQTIADISSHAVSLIASCLTLLSSEPPSQALAWLVFPDKNDSSSSDFFQAHGNRPPPAV